MFPLLPLVVFLFGTKALAGEFGDGVYRGAEESVLVKSGRVVVCDGFTFWVGSSPREGSTCGNHKFSQISSTVLSATRRDNGTAIFLCKDSYPGGGKYGDFICSPSGWAH